jgi:hypothetical protein
MEFRRFQTVLPRSAYQESAHDDAAAADAAATAAIIVAISNSKPSYLSNHNIYSGVTVASGAPFHAAAVAAAVAVARAPLRTRVGSCEHGACIGEKNSNNYRKKACVAAKSSECLTTVRREESRSGPTRRTRERTRLKKILA